MKNAIPVSQFSRIKRDTKESFDNRVNIMKSHFKQRCYEDECLDIALEKVANQGQSNKKPKNRSMAVCVLNFTDRANEIKYSIKKHWHILSSDSKIGRLFIAPPRKKWSPLLIRW